MFAVAPKTAAAASTTMRKRLSADDDNVADDAVADADIFLPRERPPPTGKKYFNFFSPSLILKRKVLRGEFYFYASVFTGPSYIE